MVAAYLNWGRWVADCDECGNAEEVAPGQLQFVCGRGKVPPPRGTCGHTEPIEWPDDPAAVEASVADSPLKSQDWRP